MPTDYVFARPNGKPYRPRTSQLRAEAWEDAHPSPESTGVIVFGTLNPDEARQMARESAAHWFGDADTFDVAQPRSGWWRNGFERGERTWVEDGDRGAPGVMFTWTETVNAPESSRPGPVGASSRAARVLWLMDRSFKARLDGDLDAEREALAQADTVDAALVAEVQTGIASGDVPDIENDPRGWNRYYLDAQEREGRDAAIVKALTDTAPYRPEADRG